MENLSRELIVPSQATPIAEIGSLARTVEAERAGHYVLAWQEALKAISLRPFHPEAYIQMASTAVAAGDPEAALRAAQRALALTPKWPTAQQVVKTLECTLNAHRKQRKKVSHIAWPELPDLNRKSRLSVCMIVKNEERFLGQCLASVKDIADELIVIDTGSTDRTVEIAREYGAQVGHFEWCDDFAAARNASIAPATGDWILFLDADEELSATEKQNLPALLNRNNVALIRLPLINAHQGEASHCVVPRLFRNIPTIRFLGCVHEGVYGAFLQVSKEWQMEISLGNLLILHHGYTPEVTAERNKVQRNYDLLVKALKTNPNSAYFNINLGFELRRMDRIDESFEAYEKALNLAEAELAEMITDEVREQLLTQYSAYLLIDKHYEKVLEVLTSDLALRESLTPGQLLVRAQALIHLRQSKHALRDVQEAYSRRNESTLFASAINPSGSVLEMLLAEVLYLNKRFQEAITYFEVIIQKEQPNLRTVLVYAECLDSVGKIGEALEFLHNQALHWKNVPEIWVHGLKLLNRNAGLKEVSKDWLTEARSYHPDCSQLTAVVVFNEKDLV
jgi:glycosyltransferase involved in cell wall biosynthesis